MGIKFNEFTYPNILKGCASTKDFVLVKQIHGAALVTGFESDVYFANTLVGLYAKCGYLLDSRRFFDEISERNVVSWNALFSCYTKSDSFREALGLFQQMVGSGSRPDGFSLSTLLNAATGLGDINQGKKIHVYLVKLGYESNPFSSNAPVDMYAKAWVLEDAIAVFENIAEPDIISWNALISGCIFHEYYDRALLLLDQMKRSVPRPNMFTSSTALKACSAMGFHGLGMQLHSTLIKMDSVMDCKCGLMKDAAIIYNLMPEKDLIALNATAGLQNVNVCRPIHVLVVKSGYQPDNFILNSLVDSNGKCSHVGDASRVFGECINLDLPSFTSIIIAYAQCGQGEEALKLYLNMLEMDLRPDSFVCNSPLNACVMLSAYERGKQIHVHLLKVRLISDVFSGNSVVNMYAKCSSIEDTGSAFSEIPEEVLFLGLQ